MKPYGKKKYHGWSHSRKTMRKMARLNLWDDLGPADYTKSSARQEGVEETLQELTQLWEEEYE